MQPSRACAGLEHGLGHGEAAPEIPQRARGIEVIEEEVLLGEDPLVQLVHEDLGGVVGKIVGLGEVDRGPERARALAASASTVSTLIPVALRPGLCFSARSMASPRVKGCPAAGVAPGNAKQSMAMTMAANTGIGSPALNLAAIIIGWPGRDNYFSERR